MGWTSTSTSSGQMWASLSIYELRMRTFSSVTLYLNASSGCFFDRFVTLAARSVLYRPHASVSELRSPYMDKLRTGLWPRV